MPTEPLPSPGLGTGGLRDADECRRTVMRALDAGYRHLDTAQKYGNEQDIGGVISSVGIDRDHLFIGTKVAEDSLGYDDVLSTAQRSLERLGVDRVDLLYVHWPHPTYEPAETLEAFNELYEDDVMRHVGVCNFTPALLDEARMMLDPPLFALQVEMHPLLQQEALHEYAIEQDCYLVAYCPLLRGRVDEVDELQDIAKKHGATPAQVSLAWLMGKDNVVPIPKCTGSHIEENYEARNLNLNDDDVALIEEIEREHRIVDPADRSPWQ